MLSLPHWGLELFWVSRGCLLWAAPQRPPGAGRAGNPPRGARPWGREYSGNTQEHRGLGTLHSGRGDLVHTDYNLHL